MYILTSRLARTLSTVLAVSAVAITGVAAINQSQAATATISIQPETGTATSPAVIQTDTAASGGQAIIFASPTPSVTDSAKPTAINTGVIAGVPLTTYTGDYTMSIDGATITNMRITGDLYMAANNITASNIKVDGSVHINMSPGGNYFFPVKFNHKLTNIDARGMDNIGFDRLSIDKSHFHSQTSRFMQLTNYSEPGRFFKADGLTLTNSLFDNLLPSSGTDHVEALFLLGAVNATITNNVFDETAPDAATKSQITATINMQGRSGVEVNNVVYEGNYFYGGGFYQVYPCATNLKFLNNKFHSANVGAILYPSCGPSFANFVQSGNTLDGAPYNMPGGM